MPPRETVRGFAAHGATMALYLSAARNKALQEELLAGGYAPETPCIVGPALAEGPLTTRSHLYHPGFRHEYRAADPGAQADLRAHGTRGVLGEGR